MNNHCPELITLEQFAERLNVSRSTAYGWLAEGVLIPGKHIMHIKRIIRILWSNELVAHLLTLSSAKLENKPPRLKRKGKGSRNQISIDCDYLDAR
jgi:hypothetical protein